MTDTVEREETHMKYMIVGDSCCDYTDFCDGLKWLVRVPLTIEVGDSRYTDTEDLDTEELLQKIESSPTAPKSACPSPGDFLAAFDSEADDIYVVTLSDKVSGTYSSAVASADIFASENPGKNIHVFNSHSAAAGEVGICIFIRELAEAGISFDEVVEKTEAYISSLTTLFALETLDVFRKNGRLSHLQSLITTVARIKLVMGADENGAIICVGKTLSMEASIKKLVSIVSRKAQDIDLSARNLMITHCHTLERAIKIRELVEEAKLGFKNIVICKAGGLSTTYANRGGIIVAF